MNAITEASLSANAIRLYNSDTGDETFYARQHIIALTWNGEVLTISTALQTTCPVPQWSGYEGRGVSPDAFNDLDCIVSAFYLGGVYP